MFTAQVRATRRLSPTFQRVTVAGPDLASFDHQGLDHWFRLFLPPEPGAALVLPEVEGRTWWQPYLDLPDEVRPHCSNYTVAGYRSASHGPDGAFDAELDIDVVLHHDHAGQLCGGVAIWATTAQIGSPMGLLDQGVLFDPPSDADEVVLVSDESGIPALRGIVHDLPADTRGRVVIEVPHADDIETWIAPPGLDLAWCVRAVEERRPGRLALSTLREGPAPSPLAYGFVIGESTLATAGRRWLVGAGLAKDRILFSGFYKVEPQERPSTAA
ncbi:siderophore-interacting protein [Nocardioides sp. CBS4Y-1]|uniref:Siderophore-interacting protein n=2 Tax=Nocardioides acrostichi TaxID=2784339 RepID=A0A930YA44_9ACTN|nr:siderophore-interacting protein [Nocardioides acrostichi]